MADYCNTIAVLVTEHHKIPRTAADTDNKERCRIHALHVDLHRQEQKLREQAAKEFAAIGNNALWQRSRARASNDTKPRRRRRPPP